MLPQSMRPLTQPSHSSMLGAPPDLWTSTHSNHFIPPIVPWMNQ